MTERRAFGLLALAAVVAWAAIPSFPNYDTSYHLVWGRELLGGGLPSFEAYAAPTQHPAWVALGALLEGLLGGGSERGAVLVTALAHVVFAWGVFRLGRATFGSGAAIVATVAAGSSFALLLLAARAYVDVPFLALVLWAAALEAEGRSRPVPWLLAGAGLLRPEAWVLAGLLFLARPSRRTFALAAAAPLLWALTDLVVTGDPLWSVTQTSALADELGRPQGLGEAARTFVTYLSGTAREPVAALGLLGLVLALRERGPRAIAVPLVLLGAGCATFLATGVLGLSVIPRYLTVPAVALCLFAGFAAVRAWAWSRALVVAALVLAVPVVGVLGADRLDRLRTELRFTAGVHDDLEAILAEPAVQRARACGPITLPNYRLVPETRLLLDLPRAAVGSRSAQPRDRGVALFLLGDKPLRRYGFADGTSPITNVPTGDFVPVARNRTFAAYASC